MFGFSILREELVVWGDCKGSLGGPITLAGGMGITIPYCLRGAI